MTALLEVAGVSKRYGGIRALDGVSLEVQAGEAVGLIGPNGAGKTTLFDCITGVRHPDRGEIRFAGERIDDLPTYRRARLGIGRTFQRIELFAGMTARDHLLVAEREHRGDGRLWKDLLWRGAPRSDEIDRVDKMIAELGLETFADAAIESLSLGQGRLVELGRALMTEPKLLLLDEPSSGLDSRETATLAGVLNDLRHHREMAFLLVEHDLDLVRAVTERVYVVDFGRLIASGSLAEVLAEADVRAAYLGEGA
ncbi:MAG TPA: ABC transporter ATP-binding protein [Acidimicrobiales bacterium]|nr:ABC transporter ATP-binding protein [Acidimicrobiales bacterium]